MVAARYILIGAALVGWAGCGKLVGIHGGSLGGDGSAGADTAAGGSTGGSGGDGGGGGGEGGGGGGGGGPDAAGDPAADRVSMDLVADAVDAADVPEVVACVNEPVREGKAFGFLGGPNVSGAVGICSFPNPSLPTNRYYGAIDTRLMGTNTSLCGVCLQLKAGNNQVEVFIIDGIGPIAPLPRYTLSIEPNATTKLGAAANSNPDVQFQIVPCSFPEKIATSFDTTTTVSSKVLVLNHRTRLTGVQIFSGGNWRDLTRERDNRWTAAFTINGTSNRMRFIDSSSLSVDATVPFTSAFSDTKAQIPSCP